MINNLKYPNESQEVNDFLNQKNVFDKPEDFKFDLRKINDPFIKGTMSMLRGQKFMMDSTVDILKNIFERMQNGDEPTETKVPRGFDNIDKEEYMKGLCEGLNDGGIERFKEIASKTRMNIINNE